MPRTPNAKFMAPVQPDAALAAIVGSAPLPRTEIIKKVWEYIHAFELQDAKNRRQINTDEALGPICGGKASITMFELPGCISAHVSPVVAS